MRVSNGGRKQNFDKNTKVTSEDIESKVSKGKKTINATQKEKIKVGKVKSSSKKEVSTETEKFDVKKESVNLEVESNNNAKGDKNNKKSKSVVTGKRCPKMSGFRIFRVVLMGILSSLFLVVFSYGIYYNVVRYPWEVDRDIESSGLGALRRWESAIITVDNKTIKDITGEDSYLAKEVDYANGNENIVKFIENMLLTVEYVPQSVEAINIYGNTMVNRNDEVVYTDSLVNGVDEEVTVKFIDYSKVPLDSEKIQSLMKDEGLKFQDVDYSNKLVNVFCKYMNSLDISKIKKDSITHVPNLLRNGEGYTVTADEDIFLDKLLFSSEDFYSFLIKFSEVASGEVETDEWKEWNKLSDEDKKKKNEPEKTGYNIKPTEAWSKWNALSDEDKEKEDVEEPTKYSPKDCISNVWCGSYYLLNEHTGANGKKSPISAGVGDGTIENPAGYNTDVVTSIYVSEEDKDGNVKRVAKPIRIRLTDFKVSQDAIDYFESKDERNRGFDIKSEVQYASYTFEITNLSDKEITIYDDSSLCDELANMSPRTGIMYGLKDEITLKPDETGVLESWGNSTELNTKYLVWGSDFKREEPVVWFRVLQGDLEDTSEDKGVTLNKSRFEDE